MVKNRSKKFIKLPEYEGGKEAFKKYIKTNLVYPKEALDKRVEGTVYLSAVVNDNGDVLQVNIEQGVGAGCDEEAIRLIDNIQFPKVKNRGVRVKIKKKFRINFKLPPQKKINFQIVNKKVKDAEHKTAKSYSYTILISKH